MDQVRYKFNANIPDELMNICDRIVKLSKVKKPKEKLDMENNLLNK